jgi:hypothetical protein
MRRFRKQLGTSKVGIVLFAVLFLVLLPLLLPVAALQVQISNRRLLKLVREFVCVACGARLGEESVRLARERWNATVAELHAKSPGIKFRLVRDIDAVCPSCGHEYTYRDTDKSLAPRTK